MEPGMEITLQTPFAYLLLMWMWCSFVPPAEKSSQVAGINPTLLRLEEKEPPFSRLKPGRHCPSDGHVSSSNLYHGHAPEQKKMSCLPPVKTRKASK